MEYPLSRYALSKIISSTTFFVWFTVRSALSQTNDVPFNELVFFSSPTVYEKCLLLSHTQSDTVDFLWYSPQSLYGTVGSLILSEKRIETSTVRFTFPPDTVLSLSEVDKKFSIAIVNRQTQSIALYENKEISDSIPFILHVPVKPNIVIPADIDNDQRADFILLNSQEPALGGLLSDPRGVYKTFRLLGDNSFISHVVPLRLNNDRYIDLLVYDWVQSTIHILYGIGGGRFLEQSVFQVQGSVRSIVTSRKYWFRTTKLAFLMKQQPSIIQIWDGNELGDVRHTQTLTFDSAPLHCFFSDLTGDGEDELVVITANSGCIIYKLQSNRLFTVFGEYGLPFKSSSVFFANASPGARGALYTWSEAHTTIASYLHSAYRTLLGDTIIIPLKINPVDVLLEDVTGDSVKDIIIAHGSERSISLLQGKRFTLPTYFQGYHLYAQPSSMKMFSKESSYFQIVVPYNEQRAFSVVTLNAKGAAKETIIPTFGLPTVISQMIQNPYVSVLNMKSEIVHSISLYEALRQGTFIEHTFQLTNVADLLGADVADLNRDGYLDIVYVYRYRGVDDAQIGIAFGDSSYSLVKRTLLSEYTLPSVDRYFLWLDDLNLDGTVDLILYLGKPWKQLWCFAGQHDGSFTNPTLIASDLQLMTRAQLRIVYSHASSLPELLIAFPEEGVLKYCYAHGPFQYSFPVTIFTDEGSGQADVGDIDGDGYTELVVVYPQKHYAKVLSGSVWYRRK